MGLYPDAPSRRMPWDTDGSVGILYTTAIASTEYGSASRAILNDEATTNVGIPSTGYYIALIFPELRELDGIFLSASARVNPISFGAIDSSQDTTNGIDGTWVNAIANHADTTPGQVYSLYRTSITSLGIPTEKGIRVLTSQAGSNAQVEAFHLYGTFSPGETPDRILFLDTLNADAVFTKPINWNEIPRGQTQTRSFKIKNNSSGLTINTIQVTAEDLFLNAGDWYAFGDDNVNFQATFAVGNLGPGAEKLLYLKQIIPDAETLGLQAGRIKVSHANLT